MAAPAIPQSFFTQQGNQQIYLSWDIVAGATSYSVNRSIDGVNFTQIATPTLNSYIDTTVTLGTQYYYQVAAANTASSQAFGLLTFTGQPNNNDTFSIANILFTAKSSGATGNQFNIGGTVAQTIVNAAAALNASPDLVSIVISAATSATVLTLTSFVVGPEGNGLQFSSTMTNTTATPFSGGSAGSVSAYTSPQNVVPTSQGEMSLGELRTQCKNRADRLNSDFVTTPEWNSYINQSIYELYDILITQSEDYYKAPTAQFTTNGSQYIYPLPDGQLTFTDQNGNPFVAPALYKLLGMDLGIQTANNAWVTLDKYNFIDRNQYLYPNSAATIYGMFNSRYRMMGSNVELIPTPSGNQNFRFQYIPKLRMLLADNEVSTTSISGWLEYVIVDAAIKALQKEESDVSVLMAQKEALRIRIMATSANRDEGRPDTVSDTRAGRYGGGMGGLGWNGPSGGF